MNYYHVIIETKERIGRDGTFEKLYEYDITDLDKIKNELVLPYLNNTGIHFKGYFIQSNNIRRFVIKKSSKIISEIRDNKQDKIPRNILIVYTKESIVESEDSTIDITTEVFDYLKNITKQGKILNKKVSDMENIFIVHGHNIAMKEATARFLEKFGLKPIILHEQANKGNTLIEKFLYHSNVNFAIVLLSADDYGYVKTESSDKAKHRARQNVVFELGFFYAKLGRERVVAVLEKVDNFEKPNDIDGIIYIPYSDVDNSWKYELAREIKEAGYNIDMNEL